MTTDLKPAGPPPAAPESDFTSEGAPPPGQVGTEAPDLPAAASKPDAGSATAPVSRQARIVGTVELRQGDGSIHTAPPGPCQVQLTALDATLSWRDNAAQGPAALPLADFNRHLEAGEIVFTDRAAV